MASAKLVLTFADAGGNSFNMSYNYADTDVTASDVQALATGIITNGSIFEKVPVTAKGAKLLVTTETEFPVSAA